MRVVVDGRHLGAGRGVARYADLMLHALVAAEPTADWVVVAARGAAPRLPPGARVIEAALPGRLLHVAGALTGRPALDHVGGGADVVWLPAPAPAVVSPGMPYVLSVHDRSFEARPRDFTAYERAWHRAARPRALAAGAARVIALSRATAEDLLGSGWPVDPGRLRVSGAGAGLPPGAEPRAPLPAGLPERYLLAVGALEPRKGTDLLAGAYAQARLAGLDAALVVAGRGRLGRLLRGAPGVILLEDADDEALDALYGGALALVHPALLEGWGMPPLEAALRGVPSVVADLPVYDETLGAAALRTVPGDPAALATALRRIAGDAELRADLGERARRAAQTLSWERAACVVLGALREAAGR